MNSLKSISWKTLFLASLTVFNLCANLCNLSVAKEAVRQYYEDGGYENDLKNIIAEVRTRFSQPALHAKQVVIFDVDDTSLSMYQWFKEHDFARPYLLTHRCLSREQFPAIPFMQELYQYLKDLGYTIIFITGREQRYHEETEANLIAQGYTAFEQLITRSPQEEEMSTQEYKELARGRLVHKGYEIVCCIDDNPKGLVGKHVGYPVHVPNYLY